jgi:hypothetical protein
MANDLGEVFIAHGWQVSGGPNMRLRADLRGILFVIDLDFPRRDKDMPPHAVELAKIFTKSGIKYSWVL